MTDLDVMQWQEALQRAGYSPGTLDGDFGPRTLEASLQSLQGASAPPEGSWVGGEIPLEWLPPSSKMVRIIAHWTAGAYEVSKTDREHYHFIWNGDGVVVLGDKPVDANESTSDNDGYAAHAKNCNSGSIGVSMACMAGAIENPFDPGDYPMTKVQWDAMVRGIAQLCGFYGIPVSMTTVLSHAEVEGNLGIDQDGKWDFTRLPFDDAFRGAEICGDRLRADVESVLDGSA